MDFINYEGVQTLQIWIRSKLIQSNLKTGYDKIINSHAILVFIICKMYELHIQKCLMSFTNQPKSCFET